MTKGKSLRNLLDVLLVLLTISAFAFTVISAATEYSLVKPVIQDIIAKPGDVKVKLVDLWGGYNATSNRYDNVTVSIKNTAGYEVSTMLTVYLYNITNGIIAQGQTEMLPLLPYRTLHVPIQLTWIGNATLIDYTRARVVTS